MSSSSSSSSLRKSVVGGDGDLRLGEERRRRKLYRHLSPGGGFEEFSVSAAGLTMYDKIVRDHTIATEDNGTKLLFIDRHMVHKVTSQSVRGFAFSREKRATTGQHVGDGITTSRLRIDRNLKAWNITEMESRVQVVQMEENVKDFEMRISGWTIKDKASCTSSDRVRLYVAGYDGRVRRFAHGPHRLVRWRSVLGRAKSSTCWLRKRCCKS